MKKKHLQPLTPAALYARVSSDRQDVDLSVSAQLRALKEYAKANGYSVAREYDARKLGHMLDRTCRDLSPEDIARVADTYHAWRSKDAGEYEDIPGFCKLASLEEIRKHGHALMPGRYVGAAPQEDDGEPFEEKMARLSAQWREQQAEARRLDSEIGANLARLGFGGDR